MGGGRARSAAIGGKKAAEAGATSPRHPRRTGSPALRGEGPGTLTQDPDTGTGHGFTSVGCVQGAWRSPWQVGAVQWWQCSLHQGSLSPGHQSGERGGCCGEFGVRPGSCSTTAFSTALARLSHVMPTARGAWDQPGGEHLGGKGNQLGGVQLAFMRHWEEPLAASFALGKPELRVGPAARLGGDGAGTQLWPCP